MISYHTKGGEGHLVRYFTNFMNIIAKEVSIMRLRTKSISIVIEDQVSPEYRSCSLPVEASAGLGLQEPLLPLLRSTKGIIR